MLHGASLFDVDAGLRYFDAIPAVRSRWLFRSPKKEFYCVVLEAPAGDVQKSPSPEEVRFEAAIFLRCQERSAGTCAENPTCRWDVFAQRCLGRAERDVAEMRVACGLLSKKQCSLGCVWDSSSGRCVVGEEVLLAESRCAVGQVHCVVASPFNRSSAKSGAASATTSASPSTADSIVSTTAPSTDAATVLGRMKAKEKQCQVKRKATCSNNCEWNEDTQICEISAVFAMAMLSEEAPQEGTKAELAELESLARNVSFSVSTNITRKQLAKISTFCHGVRERDRCVDVCEWDEERSTCDVNPLLAVRAVLGGMETRERRQLQSETIVLPAVERHQPGVEIQGSRDTPVVTAVVASEEFGGLLDLCESVDSAAMDPEAVPRPCLESISSAAKGAQQEAVIWFAHVHAGRSYVAYCTDHEGFSAQGSFQVHPRAPQTGNASSLPADNRTEDLSEAKSRVSARVQALPILGLLALAVVILLWKNGFLPGLVGRSPARRIALGGTSDHELLQQGGAGGGHCDGFAESQNARWAQLQGNAE